MQTTKSWPLCSKLWYHDLLYNLSRLPYPSSISERTIVDVDSLYKDFWQYFLISFSGIPDNF